jgi:Uncharacterized protein conserved in bacteria (DUF2147)
MKRLFPAAALLITLSSPVYAADSFSFVIGGHRIHIEAPHHCRSASCVSISIPGITQKRAHLNDGDRQVVTSAITPAAQPAVCAPPPRTVAPQAQQIPPQLNQQPRIQPVQTQQVQPSPQPVKTAAIAPPAPPAPLPQSPPPSPPQEILHPVEIAPRIPNDVAEIAKVSREVEEEPADTPLGDWHAEGQKGLVRIEPCGQSLCGYIVDAASNAKGETVLVDMKPKTASQWSGNIYSRDSGNTYYGTVAMKGPESLKVEACAVGHFFCSGTLWKRADAKPKRLITDRETPPQPRT